MKERTFPGEVLRERREELGLTIADVHARTHIPAHCVEMLEQGQLAQLPSSCYAVGFIKSYCHLLDVTPDPFVDSYQTQVRPATGFLRRPKQTAAGTYRPAFLADALAWVAVCAILGLAWFAYTAIVRPNAQPASVQASELVVPPVPDSEAR